MGAQLYGLLKGQRDGFRAAYSSLKAGQTMPLPGEVEAAKTPYTQQKAIPNISMRGIPVLPLGSIVRAPGERLVAPIHSYFRAIGYEQGIARHAYRQAASEGLSGDAFKNRVADLTAHPTPEMMEAARNEATQQTLMGKGGGLTRAVSTLANVRFDLPGLGPTRLLRFIDPFVHIASNIMEQAVLERGPLGLATRQMRANLSGANGAAAQASAGGRMAAGIALSTVAGGLALEGFITPSAPSDPHEAAMWRMVNGAPHSLKIGNLSYDLSRLGVLGFQMGIAADMFHGATQLQNDDLSKAASMLVQSIAHNFLDEGFMRGPSDMIKALDDPDRYGGSYVRNLIGNISVPYSIGMRQLATRVDPYARQARTILDEIKSGIPFESETLFPRRDIWGEPVLNREFSGVYATRLQTDPVNQAMLNLHVWPAPVKRDIRGVQLTDQQYDDYARIAGRLAKQQTHMVVASPAFAAMPDGIKHNALESAISSARQTAESYVMMHNPSIIKAATEGKKAEIAGTHKPPGGWPQVH
jgi:hypothetical protein